MALKLQAGAALLLLPVAALLGLAGPRPGHRLPRRPPGARTGRRPPRDRRRPTRGRAQPGRPTGATIADVSLTRSAGASSTSQPRRPADTNTVGQSAAVLSTTVGSAPALTQRRDPAQDVAGGPLRVLRVGHLGALAAGRGGQGLEVELTG